MPIDITCSKCHTRFKVSEKFAGKKGPCPKCKAEITIPTLQDEVVVHAPDDAEATSKDAAKVSLKPISRQETKVSPLFIVGTCAGIVLVIGMALLVRFVLKGDASGLMLGIGAFVLAPPLVWGGYSFLRDDELEPYRGQSLLIRTMICSLVYALLWGAFAWVPPYVMNVELHQLELFHYFLLIPPIVLVGALPPLLALDLDFGNGLVHYGLYILVTAGLCLIAGVNLLGAPVV